MAADTAPRRGAYQKKMPPASNEVLVRLMNEGRANKYAINNSLKKKHYSGIYKAMNRLAESLLVYPVKVGRAKTGLVVNTYDLTTLGLAFALQNLNEKADWAKMAANHKDLLPKIFGQWKFLVDHKGEELARKSLLESVDLFWEGYDYETTYGSFEEMNRAMAETISSYFILTPWGAFSNEELVQWYDILEKSSELKSWAVQTLHLVISDRLSELDKRIYDFGRFGGRLSREQKQMLSHLADHSRP
jgi:hypothetical protein